MGKLLSQWPSGLFLGSKPHESSEGGLEIDKYKCKIK